MGYGPNIGGEGRDIGFREFYASHWRHRARVAFRFRNPCCDRLGYRLQAAVAQQPFAASQIRPNNEIRRIENVPLARRNAAKML
jgi:hypothetical protein